MPVTRSTAALAGIVFAAGLSACNDEVETLVVARCEADQECAQGFLCDLGECIPKTNVSCQEVEGGAAILQPGPPVLDFERVGPATSFRALRLRNIGNCTLTIFEAFFEGGDADAFECPACAPDRFPIELFPLRETELEIAFTPGSEGAFGSDLHLLSDDGEYPDLRVPVRARFDGVPEARVLPDTLDFSFVPVGRTETLVVQVTNHGSGAAPLLVTDVRIQPTGTTAWSFGPELTMPVSLMPTRLEPTAFFPIQVRYHPQEVGRHSAELIISTNQQRNGTLRVPLSGTSQTPPKARVDPDVLDFGEIPIGQANVLPVTIINEGGAPLSVSYRWGGTNFTTDLSALPAIVPTVAPGQFTELQVFATPTRVGEITGLLIIETNDPQRPTISVQVSASGTDVLGVDVIKIEMAYENGDSGFFGDDLRDVDMTLENPFGQICNEQEPAPMTWGGFGDPSWFAFGAAQEPERIILPNAQQDGTYRVILQYAEDCASVPTQLIASVLGITVDALLGYLSGGSIQIDGEAVSDVISNLCLDHDSTQATVTVYVNGRVVSERSVGLGRKGDIVYAVDLQRQGGRWTVQ